MTSALEAYAEICGADVVEHIRQIAKPLEGRTVLHVNSARQGGGVAEILQRLVPLKQELGLRASWEVIGGPLDFFAVTKRFHNALQGVPSPISRGMLDLYMDVLRENARRLGPAIEDAEFVFIHDPQPAALLSFLPSRKGKWIWRCHIDVSRPYRPVWRTLRDLVRSFDASVFSLAAFAQHLPHPQYLVPPSIDPLSEKNIPLSEEEVRSTAERFDIDPSRPLLLQVSRFDRFKDPVGVIQAYRLVRRRIPAQLVLAGGGADDDPEGEGVLRDVHEAAGSDPDVHVLLLPPDAHRVINALQRRADLVIQKSIREGFGLTVTEALWKRKAVIGGEAGGITRQVIDHHTGFLVNTVEGAAFRIRYLLSRPEEAAALGEKGHHLVREHFLLTRHLREYLTLMLGVLHGIQDRIEVG